MRSLEYVKKHLNKFEEDGFLGTQFTLRLMEFLPTGEWEQYGYEYTGEKEYVPTEWTEENIMKKLKRDTYFGYEQARGERRISSGQMTMVVHAWLKVLELPELILSYMDDGPYHIYQFETVAKHFGWDLPKDCDDEG